MLLRLHKIWTELSRDVLTCLLVSSYGLKPGHRNSLFSNKDWTISLNYLFNPDVNLWNFFRRDSVQPTRLASANKR